MMMDFNVEDFIDSVEIMIGNVENDRDIYDGVEVIDKECLIDGVSNLNLDDVEFYSDFMHFIWSSLLNAHMCEKNNGLFYIYIDANNTGSSSKEMCINGIKKLINNLKNNKDALDGIVVFDYFDGEYFYGEKTCKMPIDALKKELSSEWFVFFPKGRYEIKQSTTVLRNKEKLFTYIDE